MTQRCDNLHPNEIEEKENSAHAHQQRANVSLTGRVTKILLHARPYLSIATLYMFSDVVYDYGLLKLPYPIGDFLYYGRYVGIVAWYIAKFGKERGVVSKVQRGLSSFLKRLLHLRRFWNMKESEYVRKDDSQMRENSTTVGMKQRALDPKIYDGGVR